MINIAGKLCRLREFHRADVPSIALHANNRQVWRNLRDAFPHPYDEDDARAWVKFNLECKGAPNNLAIEVAGEFAGGVGITPRPDVHRLSAEIGYWLGEAFWGRGIATEALGLMTDHIFATRDFVRLEAGAFGWNPGSFRVLEKNGYRLEGRHAKSVFKDGELTDIVMYARLRPGIE